jgi:hypothetical protein
VIEEEKWFGNQPMGLMESSRDAAPIFSVSRKDWVRNDSFSSALRKGVYEGQYVCVSFDELRLLFESSLDVN